MRVFRAAAVISALLAGYVGLATAAQAQLCPTALLAGQQDGVCVTDQIINPVSPTRVLFQTASEATPQEIFIALGGVPLTGLTEGLIFLTEPAGQTSTPLVGLLPGVIVPLDVSDVLALRASASIPGAIDIAFISDGALPSDVLDFNAVAAGLGVLGSIVETGDWQDVSSFFGLPAGSAFVQSDTDTVVPEPASLALLGTALLGLAAIRRRKRA